MNELACNEVPGYLHCSNSLPTVRGLEVERMSDWAKSGAYAYYSHQYDNRMARALDLISIFEDELALRQKNKGRIDKRMILAELLHANLKIFAATGMWVDVYAERRNQ
jgi:hypothetical protein